jgi:hypothetical protein
MLSQLLTLYTTPVVYVLLDRVRQCAAPLGAPSGQKARRSGLCHG